MGRFDDLKPGSLVPSSHGAVDHSKRDWRAAYRGKLAGAGTPGPTEQLVAARGNFALALDATGSMQGLIDGARDCLVKISNRLMSEASARIKLRLYVYRDYDVAHGIVECSPLSSDTQELERWLRDIRAYGGGANSGEAVEAVLEAILRHDDVDAVLIAGDEPPNDRSSLDAAGKRQILTASEFARRFGSKTVPIHTFVVGDRPDTQREFQRIADLSGGRCGRLDGTNEMIDLAVLAMLARLGGRTSVERYMAKNALSGNAKRFGNQLLLGGPREI